MSPTLLSLAFASSIKAFTAAAFFSLSSLSVRALSSVLSAVSRSAAACSLMAAAAARVSYGSERRSRSTSLRNDSTRARPEATDSFTAIMTSSISEIFFFFSGISFSIIALRCAAASRMLILFRISVSEEAFSAALSERSPPAASVSSDPMR